MSRQDKATTDKHAKMLRELVKRPENKVCADCKRNDPRWASWNLGVFVCIRCSGIHRSMGTHISKVKSVDLDVWTVDQMSSIQKWGNHRANLYWEAHLKAGHIPADHKMDSFIRSKYESRRWAMDGPPPSDPSVLENGETQEAPAPTPIITAPPSTSRPTHASSGSTSSLRSPVTRQPQPHQLLSASIAGRTTQTSQPIAPLQQQQAPAPAPSVSAANTDLFSLDFHNPTPPAGAQAQKKDMKQDILSLFSASSTSAPVQPAFGQYGGAPAAPALNAWGQSSSVSPGAAIPPVQQTGMMGNGGTGMWGANSGWNATTAPALPNMWGSATAMPGQQPHLQQQPQQQNLLNTNDIWASSQSNGGGDLFGSSSTGMQKKDDVFGDIWGGFK